MSKRILITGTGTDVGKTYVAGLVVKKLRQAQKNAAYFKAAMSGNERRADGSLIPGDARQVKEMAGITQPIGEMCPYLYQAAVSPHLAARMEGGPVELERVLEEFDRVCRRYDYVTAEGSGGILCPLRFDEKKILLEDFIRARRLACLIVANAGLGAINGVVLTAEYMKAHGIPARGIILNRYRPDSLMHRDNLAMCRQLTGLEVVACVREGDTELDISPQALEELYREEEE